MLAAGASGALDAAQVLAPSPSDQHPIVAVDTVASRLGERADEDRVERRSRARARARAPRSTRPLRRGVSGQPTAITTSAHRPVDVVGRTAAADRRARRPGRARCAGGHRDHARWCHLAASARFSSRTFTPRLAEEPEGRVLGVRRRSAHAPASSDSPRTAAIRGAWNSAAATEMSGSRPLPDAVRRSTGMSATVRPGWYGRLQLDDRRGALRDRRRRAPATAVRGSSPTRSTRRRRPPTGGRRTTRGPSHSWPISELPTGLAVHVDERTVGLVAEGHLRDRRSSRAGRRGR